MSDIQKAPDTRTEGQKILAGLAAVHKQNLILSQQIADLQAAINAKPAAPAPAPAGGRKFGDPVPTMALLGKIGDKGSKSTEKACMFGISTQHGFVSVMAFGHRKEEAEKARLMPGDEVEIIGEEPKWEEYPVGSGKGGFKTIFHGVKIIKRAPAPERPQHQDTYADYAPSSQGPAHALSIDDGIPFDMIRIST